MKSLLSAREKMWHCCIKSILLFIFQARCTKSWQSVKFLAKFMCEILSLFFYLLKKMVYELLVVFKNYNWRRRHLNVLQNLFPRCVMFDLNKLELSWASSVPAEFHLGRK